MRLERLLREHDFDHVDYCSIDVEGAERSILTDFDFAAFDITVLSVENNLRSAAGTLRDILEPAGYRPPDHRHRRGRDLQEKVERRADTPKNRCRAGRLVLCSYFDLGQGNAPGRRPAPISRG
jgi:hypothetical protein